MATWATRSRLSRSAGVEATRAVIDSAERLQRMLNELGITFEDHTGKPYQHDQRLDVAQVEGEVSESSDLWITETVKPTVLLNGRVLRPGQVIVSAQPPSPEGGTTS